MREGKGSEKGQRDQGRNGTVWHFNIIYEEDGDGVAGVGAEIHRKHQSGSSNRLMDPVKCAKQQR